MAAQGKQAEPPAAPAAGSLRPGSGAAPQGCGCCARSMCHRELLFSITSSRCSRAPGRVLSAAGDTRTSSHPSCWWLQGSRLPSDEQQSAAGVHSCPGAQPGLGPALAQPGALVQAGHGLGWKGPAHPAPSPAAGMCVCRCGQAGGGSLPFLMLNKQNHAFPPTGIAANSSVASTEAAGCGVG